MDDLSFVPLCEADLPLLHTWLNQPHMRAFYQKTAVLLAEVEAKFRPRISGAVPAFDHIARQGGVPFGKLQCYRNLDHPDYAREVGLGEGISVDLFIGAPERLGRGLGRAMLAAYVSRIAFALFPAESQCFICHDLENARARRCSLAAGFRPLRQVVEAGTPSELLVMDRQSAGIG